MPTELARAKVNLCLHVVGRRDDGMHLLDSLVVFPAFGDTLSAQPAESLSLQITGPFANDLGIGADNLVVQAARLLGAQGTDLQLEKNLPVASGIGGGSADAAACVRLLSRMQNLPVPPVEKLAGLGADIPVCIEQRPVRMSGIGEVLSSLPGLPEFWMVLVNAGEPVETAKVFASMTSRQNAEMTGLPESFPDAEALFRYLRAQRNDMQEAAIGFCPAISEVLTEIAATENCALARMSGSGGTCFGLYANQSDADLAAQILGTKHPKWWVVPTAV